MYTVREQHQPKINWLQHNLPEGLVVDASWLERHGYSRGLRKKYVTHGYAYKIHQFTLAGAPLGSWGGLESLQLPHMMTMDGKGILYVAEVKGGRVQKFRKKESNGGVRLQPLK